MANHIKCRDGGVDIQVGELRWTLTPQEVEAVRDDTELKQQLETKAGRSLPPLIVCHKNRNGTLAVARFKDGVMPSDFRWPEDERAGR